MRTMSYVELAGDAGTVRLMASSVDGGLVISDEGVEGWYSTPDSKVDMVERESGDGAHAVADEAVLYAARVVTVGVHAIGGDAGRDATLELMEQVNALAHQVVEMRLADAEHDTMCRGHLTVEWDTAHRHEEAASGTITLACADPRRYSSSPRTAYLVPAGDGAGGLTFDSNGNLQYPIQFAGEQASGNTATISNEGTSPAYPVITASGSLPQGFELNGGSGQLAYPAPVGAGAPVVLDCLTRTASILGVDVTRILAARDFPVVMPGESITLSLLAAGTGTVAVELRDTYI